MLNEISDASFAQKLQQREKRLAKRREVHLVLVMLTQCMGDMFRALVLLAPDATDDDLARHKREMKGLIDYCNASLAAISRVYGCVVPHIRYPECRLLSLRA